MAWLSSRFRGGETLVLGVTFSVKRFSTDSVRSEVSCGTATFCGLEVRLVGGLRGLKGLFALRTVGL